MTDTWDMYKCSVCHKNPVYIGSMCKDCWKAAQRLTAELLARFRDGEPSYER